MATNDEKLITLSNLEEFKNNLATVAISNSYNDLTNKPTIPDVTNYIQKSTTSGLVKNDGTIASYGTTGANKILQLNSSGKIESSVIPTDASVKEAYLGWGGKNISGSYAPIDACMNPVLSPNRIAGMKAAGITVEYSTDGGITWLDYGLTNNQKQALVTTSQAITIGKSGTKTANSKLRVTLDGIDGSVYTALNKMHIYLSTNYSNGCTVSMESYDYNDRNTWNSVITNQAVSGWSGWNILNFTLPGSAAFGGSNNTRHQRKIRLTFSHTSITSGHETAGLTVYKIYAYGGVGWTTPSTLAANGVPYSYDFAGNISCMGTLNATSLSENGTTLASKYVRVDNSTQGLSDTQKANAKTNMGVIDVIANPTLAGNEAELTSVQVGDTKYKVPTMEDIGSTITDELLDDNVKLSEDLYVYTNVGLITGASSTSPKLVGEAGDSIRDVFNTLFVGEDENPKVLIPTLSVALTANGGQTYPLVRGEIIAPKYKITYGNVDGSYQYKSLENRNSASTGVTVSTSSFTIGGTAVTPSATISNSTTTTTLTSPVNITVKSSGSSQTIAGTVTLNLGNVKTAATKLGKKATAVGSNSTGTLDSSTGKLSSSTVTLLQSVSVTSNTPLSVTKPSGAISLSTTNGGTCEVGETKTFTATITANNTKGAYPFGYFTNNTYVSTTNDAGCALTGLTLKKGSSNITTSTNDNGVAQTITHVITEGSNSITVSGSLTFSCDTTRIPATENHNKTDTSEYDYRINGSTATYSPSIASKIWSATGKYYNYYTLGTSTTPITGTKISSGTQIDNINTTYGQYLYFFSTSNSYTKIQQYDNPIWNDMTTTKLPNTITLTLASGGTGTYYVYRSDALNNMTGQTFRLA